MLEPPPDQEPDLDLHGARGPYALAGLLLGTAVLSHVLMVDWLLAGASVWTREWARAAGVVAGVVVPVLGLAWAIAADARTRTRFRTVSVLLGLGPGVLVTVGAWLLFFVDWSPAYEGGA